MVQTDFGHTYNNREGGTEKWGTTHQTSEDYESVPDPASIRHCHASTFKK